MTETALAIGINNIISRLICTQKLCSIASTSGQWYTLQQPAGQFRTQKGTLLVPSVFIRFMCYVSRRSIIYFILWDG